MLASGIDAIVFLLNALCFHRDRGEEIFVFLNGGTLPPCRIRRFVNDLGEPLSSRIFSGCCSKLKSRFTLSCSTAEGFKGGRLPAVVSNSFLKSFNVVLGVPKRSLQVVDRRESFCLLIRLIDSLPKLVSSGPFFCSDWDESRLFSGVDVLKLFGVAHFGIFFAFESDRNVKFFVNESISHEKRRFLFVFSSDFAIELDRGQDDDLMSFPFAQTTGKREF